MNLEIRPETYLNTLCTINCVISVGWQSRRGDLDWDKTGKDKNIGIVVTGIVVIKEEIAVSGISGISTDNISFDGSTSWIQDYDFTGGYFYSSYKATRDSGVVNC